jgi:ABC-2 type transport system permease protein
VDGTGELEQPLRRALAAVSDDAGGRGYRVRVPGPGTGRRSLDEWVGRLRAGEADLLLVLPEDAIATGRADLRFRGLGDTAREPVARALETAILEARLARAGLDRGLTLRLAEGIYLRALRVTDEGEQSEEGLLAVLLSSIMMMFFLYMTLIQYGTATMRSVIEEKSTRIVEVVISSLEPGRLLLGKIVGILLVGLTQYGVWMLFGAALYLQGPAMLEFFGLEGAAAFTMPRLDPTAVGLFVPYFLLGYLVYAGLFAALGSMVSTEHETQQLQLLVILPLVIPMISLQAILDHPDGAYATVLSLVPLTSPMAMLLRIFAGDPTSAEIAGSVVLLVAGFLLSLAAGARIYRVGILMTGKRATLPEVARWLRRG